MTVAEAFQDYTVLILAGHTKAQALAEMATYLHPITLTRLKSHVEAREKKAKAVSQ